MPTVRVKRASAIGSATSPAPVGVASIVSLIRDTRSLCTSSSLSCAEVAFTSTATRGGGRPASDSRPSTARRAGTPGPGSIHCASRRSASRRSNRLAHALLGLGLSRGDRVAIVSPNRPEIIELECALYKAGLVKVALNSRLAGAELDDALADAEPTACLAAPQHRDAVALAAERVPLLRHLIALSPAGEADVRWLDYETLLAQASDAHLHVEMRADELAVLHYTSGATGKLKAAMQTVGNRMASLRKVAMGRFRSDPGDVLLLSGPITHASGMFIQPTLYQGATILLLERFQPAEVLAAIETHRATMAFMVPTMIYALLAEPSLRTRDLSSLRLLSYGASPMSPARIREAWEAIGPVLSQGYGAGETTGGLIGLSIADHARAISGAKPELLSSCGRPFGESDVQVLDKAGDPVEGDAIGEICVRGSDVFAGYWRAPEQTEAAIQDGWLRTGDLARVDDEGYVYIVDRKKEMLVSGGFNVYPSEVESVLAQHPSIYEVCCPGTATASSRARTCASRTGAVTTVA